ncbi:LLM class flavin-dependent oxidoreductase [Sediminivirga luteola]|uniref:LLM class flavin-dependent oxidoreductase n=1 Tax=Sediminivirga luteola TaxID=1774748 RepID=UPI001F59286F|nr:LLM class flavin-dependent oxidoreductase [Sediminivirga luteola]MCI2265468.1 LLM class flavin-dependent oxidoreductase [Sediminivirga luteola]
MTAPAGPRAGDPGDRHMLLGANVYDFGTDAGAWRMPGTGPQDNLTARFWRHAADLAEQGGLDAIFLADMPGLAANPALRPNRMVEPLAALGAVLARTERLGVIATVSTSSNDPAELTTRLATQHVLSGGRTGWNVVTGVPAAIERDFGYRSSPGREDRYRRAEEFLEVHRRVMEALASGRRWSFSGQVFDYPEQDAPRLPESFRAALAATPPLIVQAGGSPQGRELAAATAETVFAAEMVKEAAARNYADLHERAARHGRPAPLVLPGIHMVLGSTQEEAERRFERLTELGPRDYVTRRFEHMLGIRLDQLDPHGPAAPQLERALDVPDGGSVGFARAILSYAASREITLSALLRHFSGFGHQFYVGPPEPLADIMEDWFRGAACDGFNILADANPSGLRLFVEQVVPVLRERGLAPAEPADPAEPFAARLRKARR